MDISSMRTLMQQKYDALAGMKAVIEASGRKPTQAERDKATEILDEIENLNVDIRIQETGEFLRESQRAPTRPDVGNPSQVGFSGSTPGKHFRSFADQLLAIRAAGQPGSPIDSRLYQVRAATGMSEAIPSDGGSNRGPLWK